MNSTRILVRTTTLDDRVIEFARLLQDASGHDIAFIADERRGPIDHRGQEVVGVSEAACKLLGLFCPADFAWRCGDYGYYLARQRFPACDCFWMIEYDVRFQGGDLGEFFSFFNQRPDVDFLVTYLEPALVTWYWNQMLYSRDAQPYRCMFPITRLSAPAIDATFAKRRAHSKKRLRRMLWPNDEALVATTLVTAGFVCLDFNAFGRTFYSDESFSFTVPINGDALVASGDEITIYHPVLYGAMYDRKVARLQEQDAAVVMSTSRHHVHRVARRINGLMRW